MEPPLLPDALMPPDEPMPLCEPLLLPDEPVLVVELADDGLDELLPMPLELPDELEPLLPAMEPWPALLPMEPELPAPLLPPIEPVLPAALLPTLVPLELPAALLRTPL
jgi:hypothetical protein